MAAETSPELAGAAHAAGASEAAGHEGGGGLPQFQFEYWGGQVVWLVLIFAVLYVLLGRVFVPRLRKILDTRASTIASAVAWAKTVQADADAQAAAAKAEIEQARAQSRAVASEAQNKAKAELAKGQADADARLAQQLAEAEVRIQAMRDAALRNIDGIATETAQAIIEKLTGAAAAGSEIDPVRAALVAQGRE